MPDNEKAIDEMNPIELRAAIAQYNRDQSAIAIAQPDAPNMSAEKDSAKSRDTASTLYCSARPSRAQPPASGVNPPEERPSVSAATSDRRGPESKAILYPAQLWPPIAVPSPRSILCARASDPPAPVP
jgi:hypothetical protein